MELRVGQGFDLHRLEAGRPCILGGVNIKSDLGPTGHSDADVLLHALVDALLGALGLGDIGEWFPDNDPEFKDADSAALLTRVMRRVNDDGWQVVNADATVICEKPKLSPHKQAMRQQVADLLHVMTDRVNIKAKTHEKVDAIGRGEAIAVHCVVLMRRDAE